MERKSINEMAIASAEPSNGRAPFVPAPRASEDAGDPSAVVHLELVRCIERLHRRYLDLFRVDLTRLGVEDLSPAQVMMLFTIGPDDLSVRDLIDRGYYLGSNASYNLKRLVESGYVERSASPRDRRSARIRLSEKGRQLCDLVRTVDATYHRLVARDETEARDLDTTFRTLRRLEHMWTNALRYGESRIA
ncbi:MarR family transcriptional regulator [Chelatococcus sp. SYSU_G07232]|uniref:MarR family transcriptional regulator n=1 Tax=Chelatococcus albus TaxID=3047466 RepID=A0ABT7AKT7_9HYPH|nr:MarR family transcriptional regulator [Chelatococcus sp. SYSU_G07232]MDJ1159989.1 MarR family transcriptional regulator [Chelatococcus sp. SYSU_G07232]